MKKTSTSDEEGRVTTSVRIKTSLYQELRSRATASGESINSQIEDAVENIVGPSAVREAGFRKVRRKKKNGSDLEAFTINADKEPEGFPAIDPKFWRL